MNMYVSICEYILTLFHFQNGITFHFVCLFANLDLDRKYIMRSRNICLHSIKLIFFILPKAYTLHEDNKLHNLRGVCSL